MKPTRHLATLRSQVAFNVASQISKVMDSTFRAVEKKKEKKSSPIFASAIILRSATMISTEIYTTVPLRLPTKLSTMRPKRIERRVPTNTPNLLMK